MRPPEPPALQAPPPPPTFPLQRGVGTRPDNATPELGVGDVVLGAVGLVGAIVVAALAAGLVAGGLYIWYRRRRPVTEIEARGHRHDYFRTDE